MTKFKVEKPAGEQGNPYLPPGLPDALTFEEFEGINTATTRPGVDDKQGYWFDGFMPLARQNLRTMAGLGAALWTAPPNAPIAFFDFANIGETPIMIGVHSDGGLWQVNTNTKVKTRIAADGTVTNPSRTTMGITQWGSQFVLIVSKQTDGYWLWDGTTFYGPGNTAPDGNTMPTGIEGTSIETYAGRVWISNGATVTFSAPGSYTDFSSGSGGGNFTSSDSFLRVGYTQLRQTNGFLYLIGDSSVNYISSVQTTGSPPITTFTNQNADPEVGTPWPGTVDVFGRNILFANAFGAHVSYGAAVTKISEPLDGVYNTVPNFGSLVPSAAKAIVYGKKIWILLLPIIDPITGQQTNKLLMWNGKLWWASEQDRQLLFIQHQEINSVITAYGTDGLAVFPLFAQPSTSFTKTAVSKLWANPGGARLNKAVSRFWGIFQYYSLAASTLTINIDNELNSDENIVVSGPPLLTWTTAGGLTMNWTTAGGDPMIWTASNTGITVLPPQAVGQNGTLVGMTLQTNSADMAIISAAMDDGIVGYRG